MPVGSINATEVEGFLQNAEARNGPGVTVVQIPQDASTLPGRAKAQTLSLDSDATYLITGGFCGLGKALMTWLAEKGARELLVLSPLDSKASDAEDVIGEVKSLNCMVLEVVGEVQSLEDVKRAAALTYRPIKGVIHLAESVKVWPNLFVFSLHADYRSECTVP